MAGWSIAVAAAGLWTGIVLAGLRSGPPPPGQGAGLLALGAATLCAAGVLTRHVRPRGAVAAGFVVAGVAAPFLLLGAGWAEVRQGHVAASPLALLAGRSVQLSGTLSDAPQAGHLGWTASMRVDVLAPFAPGWPDRVTVHDAVWLEGHGAPPRAAGGARVTAEGLLVRPSGDFGIFLSQRGFPAALEVGQLSVVGPPPNPVVRAADWLRGSLRSSLRQVLPRREAGLVMGLALGDTSDLDPRITEQFRATGLSHLTAVSGENLAMFMAPVLGFTVLLRLGRRTRFAVGLIAVGFFVLLTGGEPSVLRAAAMTGLVLFGVFLGRPRSPPAIVGGAVLLLLARDPTLVYSIGFQLSVAATAGMALLASPLADRLRFLPRGLALAAGTTLGAQAGVTPLLLYHFGIVPTVSVPANLLAFPAVGPGMLLGLAAGGAGLLGRPLGIAIAGAARLPLVYLEGLAARLARSPLPSITSGGGRLGVLLGGMAVVWVAAWWVRSGGRVSRRAVVLAAAVLPVFVWSSAVRAGPPGSLTVTFFDVGQGDAALVRSPGGAAILIDGGPDPEEVAVKLAALGVRRLDLMVATHPHADHVGGLPAVLARFPVALIVDPGCRGNSPFYAEFLGAVRASGRPFEHPRPGAVLRVGDVRVEVLGPERCFVGTDSDPNNDSLVLRLSDGAATIMFPGDAERQAQGDVLRDEAPLLPALVLKVPHHGGDTSLDGFILAVHAKVAIVSVGPNRYGHPVAAVLAELASDGMRVFRTDRRGDITVTFQGTDVLVRTGR